MLLISPPGAGGDDRLTAAHVSLMMRQRRAAIGARAGCCDDFYRFAPQLVCAARRAAVTKLTTPLRLRNLLY